jgi:hypothetical protein
VFNGGVVHGLVRIFDFLGVNGVVHGRWFESMTFGEWWHSAWSSDSYGVGADRKNVKF